MDQYYVYAYKDKNNKIVYIGHGCKGRAWHVGYMRGDTYERHEWKEKQIKKGRLPCDYVQIVKRNLTKKEAAKIEREMIKDIRPMFNKNGNPDSYKEPKWIQEARDCFDMGMSYEHIAASLQGPSTMTVWRHLNRAV